jgi:hypothetical protein
MLPHQVLKQRVDHERAVLDEVGRAVPMVPDVLPELVQVLVLVPADGCLHNRCVAHVIEEGDDLDDQSYQDEAEYVMREKPVGNERQPERGRPYQNKTANTSPLIHGAWPAPCCPVFAGTPVANYDRGRMAPRRGRTGRPVTETFVSAAAGGG